MQSLVVIKHGDILQNVLLCCMAGLVMPPLAAFLLEAAKETFSNRIDAPMSSNCSRLRQICENKRIQLTNNVTLKATLLTLLHFLNVLDYLLLQQ